jgi:hypothetical protein
MRPVAAVNPCTNPARGRLPMHYWRFLSRSGATLAVAVGLVGGLVGGSVGSAAQQTPLPATAASPGAPLPAVHAHRATGPITIDGKLNEPAWQDAEPMILTQQSPIPWASSPYLTEARVLLYHDALIFGFKCHDPNPKAIQNHTLTRDGAQFGDDTVTVILDTFGDRRTAGLRAPHAPKTAGLRRSGFRLKP